MLRLFQILVPEVLGPVIFVNTCSMFYIAVILTFASELLVEVCGARRTGTDSGERVGVHSVGAVRGFQATNGLSGDSLIMIEGS